MCAASHLVEFSMRARVGNIREAEKKNTIMSGYQKILKTGFFRGLHFKNYIDMINTLIVGNTAHKSEQRGAKLSRKLAIVLACSFLVSLGLFMGCSGSEQIVIAPQRDPGIIRGNVLNIVGDQPVLNATVHIISSPFTDGTESEVVSVTTATDGTGWYTANVPHGRIVVVVSKNGFKRPDPQLWSLSPGGNGRLDFVLVPGENNDDIDPRIHDPFCITCHYEYQIPDPDDDNREAWPPEGTGEGGPANP